MALAAPMIIATLIILNLSHVNSLQTKPFERVKQIQQQIVDKKAADDAAEAARIAALAKVVPISHPSLKGSNTYAYGWCTWYVKNRRPDLPNNLGNAITWVSRAAAQGLPTGSIPRVGAVGQAGNHVVYVEKVFTNGTILISEMNNKGWNVIDQRIANANDFRYIY